MLYCKVSIFVGIHRGQCMSDVVQYITHPAIGRNWKLPGLSVCPNELITQSSDAMSCCVDMAACRRIVMDQAEWRTCKAATLVTVLSKCESIYTGSNPRFNTMHNLC